MSHKVDITLDGLEDRRLDVAGLWARRAFLTVMTVAIAVGVVGWLGVRAATRSAHEDRWTVDVTYPAVARAGLDVPWHVTVQHLGGFDSTVTLALNGDYLDIYETQAFHPEPSAEWRDGRTLFLQFDAPPGDTMVVSYDAYIQPAAQ